MSGGNGKYVCVTLIMRIVCSICILCPGAEALEVLFYNALDYVTINYK
jgi:hypothetical protein